MSDKKLKVIFGAYTFSSLSKEASDQFISTLKKFNVKDLDTARIYPENEKTLGELNAAKDFTIHTKIVGFAPGQQTKENVLASAKVSFDLLKTDQVETLFLHSPDPDTPIESTLSAIQEIYQQGKFKHFGLSNFSPEEVQAAYDLAKKNNWVLPTVYQGNYNPAARHNEAKLLPLLKKLKIAFYAYSPLAGGFLVQSVETLNKGDGRFGVDTSNFINQIYQKLYNKGKLVDGLKEWEDIAKEAGVSKSALAYRWVTFNSALKAEDGDGIIIGASKLSQLEETLEALKAGPLDEKIVSRINKFWEIVKDDAPTDNFRQ